MVKFAANCEPMCDYHLFSQMLPRRWTWNTLQSLNCSLGHSKSRKIDSVNFWTSPCFPLFSSYFIIISFYSFDIISLFDCIFEPHQRCVQHMAYQFHFDSLHMKLNSQKKPFNFAQTKVKIKWKQFFYLLDWLIWIFMVRCGTVNRLGLFVADFLSKTTTFNNKLCKTHK